MTTPATETLSRTEGLQGVEMKEPDEVSAMLRLKALGWGARRIAAGLGCSRTTARRWLRQGGWRRPPPPSRPKGLDGLEAWLAERFRRHGGNADVVRQELASEKALRSGRSWPGTPCSSRAPWRWWPTSPRPRPRAGSRSASPTSPSRSC